MSELCFSGSYACEDVCFLLKPVDLAPTEVTTKEGLIQSGARHYSEMLSVESPPEQAYIALYRDALARNGARLAQDIANLARSLLERATGDEIVIASLARAGTPIGVLLTRALRRMGVRTTHFSVSIIRDRGIDLTALAYIASRHRPGDVVFVDGWTGKGAIAGELAASLAGRPMGFVPWLAVVADPAGRADLAATGDDYLIASGLLNGIVSGLISRSVLNDAVVGPGDFHACVYYRDLVSADVSREFVDTIDALVRNAIPVPLARSASERAADAAACATMIDEVKLRYHIADRNRIKPGIAEATRAVLRRVPERLLIRDMDDPDVRHLVHLAVARDIGIEPLGAGRFRAAAVIKSLGFGVE